MESKGFYFKYNKKVEEKNSRLFHNKSENYEITGFNDTIKENNTPQKPVSTVSPEKYGSLIWKVNRGYAHTNGNIWLDFVGLISRDSDLAFFFAFNLPVLTSNTAGINPTVDKGILTICIMDAGRVPNLLVKCLLCNMSCFDVLFSS